jgi:hypothetical protein
MPSALRGLVTLDIRKRLIWEASGALKRKCINRGECQGHNLRQD